jgi:hypothetical protein
VTPSRAHIESLLEGVPLPATGKVLVKYAKRNGDKQVTKALKALPSKTRYSMLDDVGEALEPVQPQWPRERRVPKAESDLPPGGRAYGKRPG